MRDAMILYDEDSGMYLDFYPESEEAEEMVAASGNVICACPPDLVGAMMRELERHALEDIWQRS